MAQAVDPFGRESARAGGVKHSSDRAAPSAREPTHSDVPVVYPRANITIDRFIKHGGSSGCKACDLGGPIAEEYKHTKACHQRFDRLVFEDGLGRPSADTTAMTASQILINLLQGNDESELDKPIATSWLSPQDDEPEDEYAREVSAMCALQQSVNDIIEEAMSFAGKADVDAAAAILTEQYTRVSHALPSMPAVKQARIKDETKKAFVEFCCDEHSQLGTTAEQNDITFLRPVSYTHLTLPTKRIV